MKIKIPQQKINYDNIVTGKDLDYASYEKKINLWKGIISRGETSNYLHLLSDLTLYSYSFFKDHNGNPFQLSCYQDAIAQCLHDGTEFHPNRFILFKAANQIGKTGLLASKSIHHALNEKNKNIVIVSNNLRNSQRVLADIRQLLNTSEFSDSWHEDVGETRNTTQLTFKKEDGSLSRIICAPAGEGLLGYPVHYLFLDEFDFYEDGVKFFFKIARPRTNFTKGQIIGFSNPNPDISRTSSILYQLWTGDLFKRKFSFNYLDAPWNSKESFERDKRNTPSHYFASTHLGEFSEESGSFFSYAEIQDMLQRDWHNVLPAVDRPVYIGLDLGKMNDQTVLTLGITKDASHKDDKYKDLDVKYIEEFPLKTSYDAICKRLKEIITHYKSQHGIGSVGFDATGQKTLEDLLKRWAISAVPVDFSAKKTNKTQLFNDFKLMVENRKIKCVYTEKCEKQLSELMFKQTETKKLKVEARTENIHDDVPDSLAILIHVAVCPSRVPITLTVVNSNKINENKDGHKPTTDKDVENYLRKTIKQNRDDYFIEKNFSFY